MKLRKFISIGALIAVAATGVSHAAEGNRPERKARPDRPDAPRQFPGRPDGPGMQPGQMLGGPAMMRVFSILTPEQRTSLREMLQDNREKVRGTEEKLAAARRELMEAGLKSEFDEKAVRKQARIVAELEAERMVQMAKALSKLDPPLTEEQKKELRNPAPMEPRRDGFRMQEGRGDEGGDRSRQREWLRRRMNRDEGR